MNVTFMPSFNLIINLPISYGDEYLLIHKAIEKIPLLHIALMLLYGLIPFIQVTVILDRVIRQNEC